MAGLPSNEVARHLLVLTVALTLGMLATGLVADGFARIGIGALGVVGFTASILVLPLVLLIMEVHPRGYWVWALFGLLSNLTIVVYPAISAHFTVRYAGRAMTALNLLLFLGAFLMQYLIGAIIDLWPPGPEGGYHPEGYQAAFWLVGLLLVLGWGGSRCRAASSGTPRSAVRLHRYSYYFYNSCGNNLMNNATKWTLHRPRVSGTARGRADLPRVRRFRTAIHRPNHPC